MGWDGTGSGGVGGIEMGSGGLGGSRVDWGGVERGGIGLMGAQD